MAYSIPVFSQSKKYQTYTDRIYKSYSRPQLIPFTDGNNKFGYMDSVSHSIVIPAIYDQTNRFYNGMAVIRLNNKYGFAREDGKVITPKYDLVTLFREGYSAVFNGVVKRDANNKIKDLTGLYGYIDRYGNEVIAFKYDIALSFSEGLGLVSQNHKTGYIDKAERIAIPFIYQDGDSFKNGKARVKLNNEWIYINVRGERIIDTTAIVKLPKYYGSLCETITNGEMEDISRFISKGADLNTKYNGKYPIEYVFERRKKDNDAIFKLLIDNGCDVNAKLMYDEPLIFKVITYGYSDINKYEALKILIDKKVNINTANTSKNTIMHALCWSNDIEQSFSMAKLLIENGADLTLQNDLNDTPLKAAKKNKRKDLVELIQTALKKNT